MTADSASELKQREGKTTRRTTLGDKIRVLLCKSACHLQRACCNDTAGEFLMTEALVKCQSQCTEDTCIVNIGCRRQAYGGHKGQSAMSSA